MDQLTDILRALELENSELKDENERTRASRRQLQSQLEAASRLLETRRMEHDTQVELIELLQAKVNALERDNQQCRAAARQFERIQIGADVGAKALATQVKALQDAYDRLQKESQGLLAFATAADVQLSFLKRRMLSLQETCLVLQASHKRLVERLQRTFTDLTAATADTDKAVEDMVRLSMEPGVQAQAAEGAEGMPALPIVTQIPILVEHVTAPYASPARPASARSPLPKQRDAGNPPVGAQLPEQYLHSADDRRSEVGLAASSSYASPSRQPQSVAGHGQSPGYTHATGYHGSPHRQETEEDTTARARALDAATRSGQSPSRTELLRAGLTGSPDTRTGRMASLPSPGDTERALDMLMAIARQHGKVASPAGQASYDRMFTKAAGGGAAAAVGRASSGKAGQGTGARSSPARSPVRPQADSLDGGYSQQYDPRAGVDGGQYHAPGYESGVRGAIRLVPREPTPRDADMDLLAAAGLAESPYWTAGSRDTSPNDRVAKPGAGQRGRTGPGGSRQGAGRQTSAAAANGRRIVAGYR